MPNTVDTNTEAQWVEFAIAGDEEAFGKLYLLYLDAIYRYIYFRVGSDNDAEDICEQTFLHAWEALPNYQIRGFPFSSWLYKIAHNLVVEYRRRQKPVETSLELGEMMAEHETQYGLLGQVIATEEAAILAKAISRLSDEQQQIIILRFIEGMSHTEIARITDRSEGACRMLQYRALAALNELLQPVLG